MTITKVTDAGLDRSRIVTPLIINGDMQIAQRGTSTASITGTGVFVVDRWKVDEVADSTLTMSQETLTSGDAYNNGFKKSLKVLVTTADSSIGSSQSVQLMQHVEAQNLQGLKFGTSGAKNLTLSFWYKSNVTGVHTVCIDKPDTTRTTCPLEFTVSSSGTWEKHVLNANANSAVQGSSGAIANDNGTGFRVMWGLAYGSSYLSGTSGTWEQNGTGSFSTSNQQNIVGSSDNYVEVTGVQLEIGEFDTNTIPSFPFESFENNFRKCQRYYYRLNTQSSGQMHCMGGVSQTTTGRVVMPIPTNMRAVPTSIETTGTASDYRIQNQNTGTTCSSVPSFISAYFDHVQMNMAVSSGLTVGDYCALRSGSTDMFIGVSSEL